MKFVLVESIKPLNEGNNETSALIKKLEEIIARVDKDTGGDAKECNLHPYINDWHNDVQICGENPIREEEFIAYGCYNLTADSIDDYYADHIYERVRDALHTEYEVLEINLDRYIENYMPELLERIKNPMLRRRVAFRKLKAEREERGEMDESLITEVYPNKGESKDDFISRFMSVTKDEYPDQKQRYAVALSYWDRRNKSKKK